jgi:hypothetical protein
VAESSFSDVVKRQSAITLVAAGAVLLVVGLVAGFGIGYKVEQSRVSEDVNNLKDRLEAAKKASPTTPTVPVSVRVVGNVDATTGNSVTVKVKDGSTKTLTVSDGTLYASAIPGSTADIVVGSRVVWKPVAGSLTKAEEIIVLPAADARMGALVTATTSDSVTFKGEVKVDISDAQVEKTESAKKGDVKAGKSIVAQTRQSKTTSLATQIIVLPSNTKFA